MASQNPDTGTDTTAMLAAVGIEVTEEGKARARRRLDDARARWTPALEAEAREQLGLPARAA
ncbi:hypothetical protein JNW91_18825 [Micromonospora sp. STR1_7]|uniref:Uncharacterized protein n=1 Tax=Micromonospora parastrephiae TaxID=2806101 RepID=A0ABS1XX66_9ACTN|nr:hypothetical protein [Micromonospora parastrephiae]MBM0233724.1 hypothetical protein [Micromonospora parastrephiae]